MSRPELAVDICVSKWYRKYWHPWGYTIGWHDEQFVSLTVDFGAVHIARHFYRSRSPNKMSSRVRFHSFVDRHNHIHRGSRQAMLKLAVAQLKEYRDSRGKNKDHSRTDR